MCMDFFPTFLIYFSKTVFIATAVLRTECKDFDMFVPFSFFKLRDKLLTRSCHRLSNKAM